MLPLLLLFVFPLLRFTYHALFVLFDRVEEDLRFPAQQSQYADPSDPGYDATKNHSSDSHTGESRREETQSSDALSIDP